MVRALKFTLGLFIHSLTIVIVLIAVLLWWISVEFKKPGPLTETLLFEVEKGQNLSAISVDLHHTGAIENPQVLTFAARLLDMQRKLQAGEYELAPGMSAQEILLLLTEGKTYQRRFTIPEGLTSYETVNLLNNVEELTGEISAIPVEGSLLPETYNYRRNEHREQIIGRLEQAMTDTIDSLWPERIENLPIKTKEEAIILASIVEKETGVGGERQRVAGVFINRLRKNIALQTDPTVIYALTQGKHKNEGKGPLGRRLLKKDLEFDSPYNTYLYPGLPPGPIANPGRAAIEAALNPEDHDFFYFVADGTGGHVFAKTLDEHNRNVAKWRKIRKKLKK